MVNGKQDLSENRENDANSPDTEMVRQGVNRFNQRLRETRRSAREALASKQSPANDFIPQARGVQTMLEATRTHYPLDLERAAHPSTGDLLESTAADLLRSFEAYAREKPVSVALWALGIGFVLGWKLKPW
jgi:hypothetical protein